MKVDDSQTNLRLEYELIHKTRIAWSDIMMRWRQIVFPLVVSIISFFILFNIKFWLVGWLLGIGILIYWRLLEKHIDTQIIGFYSRLVEIEKSLEISFYSLYIFNNLNQDIPEVKNLLFKVDGKVNYDGLLKLANEYRTNFVGNRSHELHNWVFWIYFSLGSFGAIIYYPLLLIFSISK
jgi:hypothetical protein